MQKRNNLLKKEEIKEIINEVLYENELINEEIYYKCGKPHISALPYDNRTNDPEKLQKRKDAINEKLKETKEKLADIEQEAKWFYHGDFFNPLKRTTSTGIIQGKSTYTMFSKEKFWDSYKQDLKKHIKPYEEYIDSEKIFKEYDKLTDKCIKLNEDFKKVVDSEKMDDKGYLSYDSRLIPSESRYDEIENDMKEFRKLINSEQKKYKQETGNKFKSTFTKDIYYINVDVNKMRSLQLHHYPHDVKTHNKDCDEHYFYEKEIPRLKGIISDYENELSKL